MNIALSCQRSRPLQETWSFRFVCHSIAKTSGVRDSPGILQKVELQVIDHNECQEWYKSIGRKETIFPTMVCAGFKEGGKDSCQGDSGGPLTAVKNGRSTLVGLVSWGVGCARPKLPGVYTKISEYTEWIEKVTR
ncbi:hypothetical protein JTE90_023089 [Oedothorax gibbosus]|uniref:Peptidase S1 domain-containing protein n=1 Tax=Oedothorax gibbosus TaxID=931172 RepID=A0AAV6UZR0_9ARAC|nr:hypothetical protein JTE90_023089 [Oedothorax gibbosus]